MRQIILSILAILFLAGTALAQTAQQPSGKSSKQAAGKQAAWKHECAQSKDKKTTNCRIIQNLVVRRGEKQQRLLTVIVRPQPKAKLHSILLALPHGLFLPAGVQITVDEGKPIKLPVQTSDAAGAYAGVAITQPLLSSLKKGKIMKVSFVSASRKGISIPVSLAGFTSAYGKLPAAVN